jgi:glucuronokinase
MIINTRSYARAGLLGNPSDGYYGKTISFTMRNFRAQVELWESPEMQFLPGPVDDAVFHNAERLLKEIDLYGYYGGVRLMKAGAKVFFDYCREHHGDLPKRNFTVRYRSNIPRLVGLGGSSALISALFKALTQFYEVEIERELMPTLCLHAETQELGIQAGLQDRVIQVYDGVMFMDFDETLVRGRQYGIYTRMQPASLPNVYVAYDPQRAELSGRYHHSVRALFERNDKGMVAAMAEFAALAQTGYDALVAGDTDDLPQLINRNFDLRDAVMNVSEPNRRMVTVARRSGASAKFAGSGGAIVGTYTDDAMYRQLKADLQGIGCALLKPKIPKAVTD